MTIGDWIALAGVFLPVNGAVIASSVKLAIALTRLTDKLDDHERRLTGAGL